MQTLVLQARREGKIICFVPTMGYLHEGHASLLREGRKRGDLLVLSIFVNPAQFGPSEDFEAYPRDMERDGKIAAENGVDVIFTPSAADMYPSGSQTFVNVEELTRPLCGASRPGHFRGVTTVVAKLFNIVQPHMAFFGNKDYQQLAVIRRMAIDLNMPVEVVGMPIVRESDGLAMSSRNVYLSGHERELALSLSRVLRAVRAGFGSGVSNVSELRKRAFDILANTEITIDYLEFRNKFSLAEVDAADADTLVAVAVKIGRTRLIDNTVLGEED